MEKKKEENKTITLGDLILAIKKNWIVMAIIVVAVTLVGSLYVKLGVTPTYSAYSSIIIQVPNDTSSASDDVNISDSIRYVYTVTDLITDDKIADEVAVAYNATHDDKITSNLVIAKTTTKANEYSLYVKIKVQDTNKQRAVDIVNLITDSIVSMQNDGNDSTTDDLLCFISASYRPTTDKDTSYVGPNVILYVIASFIAGIVCAGIFVFLKEFASNRFKTKDEIEAIGYPVIGVQYDVKDREKNPGHDLVEASIGAMDPYNKVLNGIKYSDFNKDNKVIMITSTGADELKSNVVSNLAYTAANNKKKSIVIDLDIRKARVHQVFNLNRTTGIVEYLDGEITKEELIKPTVYGVDVITVGKQITNPIVILESEKLKELIKELKEEYDYVFIDTPPLLVCSDALIISKMVDGVIFNVAINQFRKKDIKESLKSLNNVEANILGINITKYKSLSKNDYYYYSNKYYSSEE